MATPGLQQHQQPPGPGRHRWPPPPGGAAPAPVRGMTDSPPPAVGCVLSGLTGTLSPSRSCSVCTSPSSPPATGTGPAAPTAICQPPCRNGGSCVQPGRCRCPAGWQGDTCQSDVDECSARRGGCPQRCVNTAGSYWCQCWEGHSLSADGTLCVPKGGPPRVAPNPTGADSAMKEEVQRLQSRVDLLEEVRRWGGAGPHDSRGPGPGTGSVVSWDMVPTHGWLGVVWEGPGPGEAASSLLTAKGALAWIHAGQKQLDTDQESPGLEEPSLTAPQTIHRAWTQTRPPTPHHLCPHQDKELLPVFPLASGPAVPQFCCQGPQGWDHPASLTPQAPTLPQAFLPRQPPLVDTWSPAAEAGAGGLWSSSQGFSLDPGGAERAGAGPGSLPFCTRRSCSWCWPHCTAWPRRHWSMGSRTPAASWCTPSSSWAASTP
ncbi:epidermal growth factor-like protein 7 isoform X3 [Pan troglodytes]|uniref:epidermal growth factor-like protein 7 isoform X3 n=2 Tax=Pan troglodytes TaxID=9598 RepID=UPI0007DBD639|nr:epidermal growth factor-like protein 7 isoform X3 [Pan troglodytes]